MILPLVLFFILFLVLFVGKYNFNTDNIYSNVKNVYRGQPTKCFDCERELPSNLKYLGGPTKCFSCEQQYINMYGPEYADLAQPTKCFDCERQYL